MSGRLLKRKTGHSLFICQYSISLPMERTSTTVLDEQGLHIQARNHLLHLFVRGRALVATGGIEHFG